jgi:hypothetical protein
LNYNEKFIFTFCCALFVPIPDLKFFVLGSDFALGSSPFPGLHTGFAVSFYHSHTQVKTAFLAGTGAFSNLISVVVSVVPVDLFFFLSPLFDLQPGVSPDFLLRSLLLSSKVKARSC